MALVLRTVGESALGGKTRIDDSSKCYGILWKSFIVKYLHLYRAS